tara:strand:- start:217 stop:390 length:174 start_codon:yes stop_codon:yes gene_type:complete
MAKAKTTTTSSSSSTPKSSSNGTDTLKKEIAALKAEVAHLTSENQTLQLMVGKAFQS